MNVSALFALFPPQNSTEAFLPIAARLGAAMALEQVAGPLGRQEKLAEAHLLEVTTHLLS